MLQICLFEILFDLGMQRKVAFGVNDLFPALSAQQIRYQNTMFTEYKSVKRQRIFSLVFCRVNIASASRAPITVVEPSRFDSAAELHLCLREDLFQKGGYLSIRHKFMNSERKNFSLSFNGDRFDKSTRMHSLFRTPRLYSPDVGLYHPAVIEGGHIGVGPPRAYDHPGKCPLAYLAFRNIKGLGKLTDSHIQLASDVRIGFLPPMEVVQKHRDLVSEIPDYPLRIDRQKRPAIRIHDVAWMEVAVDVENSILLNTQIAIDRQRLFSVAGRKVSFHIPPDIAKPLIECRSTGRGITRRPQYSAKNLNGRTNGFSFIRRKQLGQGAARQKPFEQDGFRRFVNIKQPNTSIAAAYSQIGCLIKDLDRIPGRVDLDNHRIAVRPMGRSHVIKFDAWERFDDPYGPDLFQMPDQFRKPGKPFNTSFAASHRHVVNEIFGQVMLIDSFHWLDEFSVSVKLEPMKTLRGAIRPTTFIESAKLRDHLGLDLTIATETFQHTGSFKFRAAYNLALSVEQHEILTASSGNFGQALALACKLTGKKCTVVMPDTSANVKIEAVRGYGSTVDLVDTTRTGRNERVAQLAEQMPNAYLASAYDDNFVIEGNSSLGDELAAENFDVIITAVGGGGLISGLITGYERSGKTAEIIGAEPLIGNDAARSLRAGKLVVNESEPKTIADGARTISLGKLNWEIIRNGAADIIEVSDDTIVDAMRMYFLLANLKCEPTGALSLGAILEKKERFVGKKVCVVVSGANVDPAVYCRLIGQ